MELPTLADLQVKTLGPCPYDSPLAAEEVAVREDHRVLVTADSVEIADLDSQGVPLPSFEVAGPRRQIYFDPARLTAGIVTCGGLCPGLNNVIRSLVMTLHYHYGVRDVFGFRYGYAGLVPGAPYPPVRLDPRSLVHVHGRGGTVLGSSRGPQDPAVMVDRLQELGVRLLFAVGGDGTFRGAIALCEEIERRNARIAVVGIPKTIDNDISWVWQSFGFSTAVEKAREAIVSAHSEALGMWNGIGLVKLMGRHSGFIAAHATLANSDVNFCLAPEAPFRLEGEDGLLAALDRRLAEKHHAVIVVAEGAGQHLMVDADELGTDASGNPRLGDIGGFLSRKLHEHFEAKGEPCALKYIDPSYMIRSQAANSIDSEFCLMLGQHAVHAGMSGRTGMFVGRWNHTFTCVPLQVAVGSRRQIDVKGNLWRRVLEATGQGDLGARAG